MSMIGFPLLLIPLAIYNIFAFLMPGVAFTSQIANVTLPSRVQWSATFGDALLAVAVVLLLLEIVKASRPGTRYLTDHFLSLLVFLVAVIEFTMLAPFGTSTFFLLTVLTAVEFLACVVIGLRHRAPLAAARSAEVARHEPEIVVPQVDEVKPIEPKRLEAALRKPDVATDSPSSVEKSDTVAAPVAAQPSVSVTPSPNVERKIAEWNVSDLVSGHDTKAASADAAQPTVAIPPKP